MSSLRAAATLAMFLPRRASMRLRSTEIFVPAGWRWMASTAAQRTSLEPCLVMCPRRTTVSDSRCWGVSPAHEHRWLGSAKRCTSPISATNTAPRIGPTPGSCLNRRIAAIAVKLGGDLLGEPPLVGVENVDQLQQRGHPLRVRGAERHPGQALAALDAEQVGHRDQHTGLGEHGMRLCFEARAQRDELRAVAQAKPPARSTLSGVPDWQTLAQAAATMPRLPNPAWKGRPELFDWHPLSDPRREADLEAALQLCAHCPALVRLQTVGELAEAVGAPGRRCRRNATDTDARVSTDRAAPRSAAEASCLDVSRVASAYSV